MWFENNAYIEYNVKNRFFVRGNVMISFNLLFFLREREINQSVETMALNISPATLPDQQKSLEPSAHRTFSQEGEVQSLMPSFCLPAP